MTAEELLKTISLGETSTVQFKEVFDNQDKIAAEMIAFANSKGGMIIFGVKDKTGEITGLDYEGLQTINNKIAAIATDMIKPPVFLNVEAVLIKNEAKEKRLIVAHIEEGIHKPYKDRNGTIWVKQGSDKRKLTDNDEILRLFQQSGTVYADEMIVPDTGEADIDKDKVEEYLAHFSPSLGDNPAILNKQLYHNLRIMKNDQLTLGGLLFFGKDPQQFRPAFGIAAISFFGNSIGGTEYRDSRNITGTIPKLFKEGMSFFNANLLHKQNGQNFNSEGILEISVIALEELLQNALVHRDYSRNSPIRLAIFDNRIEIISPGKLPNGLTVESIKLGQAVVRNNLLRTYCSRFMIYRGFGSGITRALENQPNIEFINDVEGEQFIVKIPRG
ncbi:transcriptional regulator [Spirochaetia bacterium]|nr:transcriptional regulator [Spirochaetia bacterium]